MNQTSRKYLIDKYMLDKQVIQADLLREFDMKPLYVRADVMELHDELWEEDTAFAIAYEYEMVALAEILGRTSLEGYSQLIIFLPKNVADIRRAVKSAFNVIYDCDEKNDFTSNGLPRPSYAFTGEIDDEMAAAYDMYQAVHYLYESLHMRTCFVMDTYVKLFEKHFEFFYKLACEVFDIAEVEYDVNHEMVRRFAYMEDLARTYNFDNHPNIREHCQLEREMYLILAMLVRCAYESATVLWIQPQDCESGDDGFVRTKEHLHRFIEQADADALLDAYRAGVPATDILA